MNEKFTKNNKEIMMLNKKQIVAIICLTAMLFANQLYGASHTNQQGGDKKPNELKIPIISQQEIERKLNLLTLEKEIEEILKEKQNNEEEEEEEKEKEEEEKTNEILKKQEIQNTPIEKEKQKNINETHKKVQLSLKVRQTLGGVIYGEANFCEIEMRKILGIILNRAEKIENMTMDQAIYKVLTAPNQFQAIGKRKYNEYVSGNLTGVAKEKAQLVDKIINDLEKGVFNNPTEALYFIHGRSGFKVANTGIAHKKNIQKYLR